MIEIISIGILYTLLLALGVAILRNANTSIVKKFFLGLIWILCLGLIGFYTYRQISQDNNFIELEVAFKEGKTLNCEGFLVNKRDFNIIGQTYMLIGKSDSPTSNIIISLEKCKIIIPTQDENEEDIDGYKIDDIEKD